MRKTFESSEFYWQGAYRELFSCKRMLPSINKRKDDYKCRAKSLEDISESHGELFLGLETWPQSSHIFLARF